MSHLPRGIGEARTILHRQQSLTVLRLRHLLNTAYLIVLKQKGLFPFSFSCSVTQFCLLLPLLSRFSHVRLCVTPWTAAYQAPPSLDSSGKNTGVGCHFLLQCMKVKSESEVAQSCPTSSNPMDCSLPGSLSIGFSRQEYWSGVPLPSLKKMIKEI